MGKRIAKKVLWIGWDAADWKAINPLLDQGLMPNLEKMISEGTMGNLATLDPPMSPTLWTAMATGKRPYKHGIHGFTEIDPSGEGVRPSYITSRKVKAIWNMLMHHDMVTHQVGWWPSHPAEPTNGIYISNFWHKAGKSAKNWPLKEGCVHPKEMEPIFKDLRIHPNELTFAHLQPFIPNGHEMNQNDPKIKGLLNSCRKITTDAASIQAAATYIMDNHEYDLMCVYFDAIDHYGHGFMKYHPPRRPHIPQEIYKYFNYVVSAGYRYHDMILGRLLQMAGEDTTVFLVSDHGFHPDHLRPKSLPIREEPAAPALEHSPFGIIVAKGPGIKKDERIYGASLIDMCPTILSVFGLPVAKDFDGKVLMNLFEEPFAIDQIDSWENIDGECGQHKTEEFIDKESAKEELQQLIDLGYIEDPGGNVEKALENTRKTNKYFMARAFVDGGRAEDALPLYEELWEEYRDNTRFGIRLANCYMSLDMIDEAREIMDDIIELKIHDSANINVLNGTILMKEKKFQEAIAEFESAFQLSPKSLGINLQLANGYVQVKKFKKAKESVEKELELNYENANAHRTLGSIYMALNSPKLAVESFLNAIGLKYHFPMAHYNLGTALAKIGDFENAAVALEIAVKQFPRFVKARRSLIKLYSNKLENPKKLEEAKKELTEVMEERKTIYVVSGFERAGSSLLMHLLDKMEVPLYTDNTRPADEHNPKGYFEHKHIEDIRFDKNFLSFIPDKTIIKIYKRDLPFLPRNHNYKIVCLERPFPEIIHSKQKIKQGNNAKAESISILPLMNLERTDKRINKWFENFKFVEHLKINFENLKNNTAAELDKVGEFFNISINLNLIEPSAKPLRTTD